MDINPLQTHTKPAHTKPAKPLEKPSVDLQKIKKLGHEFEKTFVAEMLNISKIGVPKDEMAQGHYGQMFGSFITNNYAEQITKSNGGFGIAKMVEDSLMKSL